MIAAVAMSLMLVTALSVFAYLVLPRAKLVLAAAPQPRFDHIPERIKGVLQFAIGQWRMPRELIAGFAHIFIFAGFMVVQIATIQHFVHAYVPGWQLWGLRGGAQDVYMLIKDVFELLVVVGVTYGLWRRLKRAPSRVGKSWEGVFVLCMIMTLMLTDFIAYGGELVVEGRSGLPWNPAGHAFALVLKPLGVQAAGVVAAVAYWLHCLTVLVFLNFLPIGKHFHVITGIPDVFFRRLSVAEQVPVIDLEKTEKFGIQTTADLGWKMVLDTYSCTECGRCNVYCPTMLTGKPLSHRQMNIDIKKAMLDDYPIRFGGPKPVPDDEKKDSLPAASTPLPEAAALPDLVGPRISLDTIWACTTCGSCEQECPVFIEQVPRIIQMRMNKVLMEGDIVPELARAFKGMENQKNPWGIGFDKRDEWAKGLDVPRMQDEAAKAEPPLLYWIGCAGSFDDRNKKITLAMVKILRAADVNFAILGAEEGCTGDAARRTGNEYLFQMLAMSNVEVLNRYKTKKILTHCPHCYHTLKTEYPQFGGNFELIHHTQFIEQLIVDGRLKLTKEVKTAVAYHDSCYLGRYHNIYNAPRAIVKAIPGASLVELPRNKSRSVCCGAGGGRFWMEEHIGERINEHRAKEALAAGTDTVGSACPFCLIMMRDGVNALGREDVKTRDIAELVAQAIDVPGSIAAQETAAPVEPATVS
ncbi:MAG: (Fe-S)-binding protein [Clostridia bacterium]|nr:(Fe-S)-binding protein [Deltaproteobacteria bacterium]